MSRPHNNGLQLTRSARSAHRATDRGQSLRAALAAEAECCTERGTDRRQHRASALRGRGGTFVVGEVKRPSMCGVGQVSRRLRPSVSARPDIFQHHVGHRSTHWFPSAASWLVLSDETTKSGFPVGTPRLGRTRPHNNGLQLTRSARCALRPTDRGQSLRAALAAEAEC
jgi:hypothetical protein